MTLDDGTRVRARRLLVATGAVDELPDVPGLAQRWGRDVVHCPYCHGWEVRDAPLGVLATGPLALHQALLFRQWSADVVLFLHTAPPPGPDERERLAARGVRVVEGRVAEVVVEQDRLTGLRLDDGSVVARAALAVGPRVHGRVDAFAALGLAAVEQRADDAVLGTAVPADAMGATAVPGVRVAGKAWHVERCETVRVGMPVVGGRPGSRLDTVLVLRRHPAPEASLRP